MCLLLSWDVTVFAEIQACGTKSVSQPLARLAVTWLLLRVSVKELVQDIL